MPRGQATAVHRAPDRPGVRERAVEFGPGHLFGVFSEPEDGIDSSAPTVIFLNVGLIGHQGPGRLWVELARACAAAGNVRCLRVDLSGIGDSPARPGRTELRGFPHDAPEDMEDIRRAVTEDGSELILVGVCSGADHSIEMALAEPVAALCVINPAFSYARWGDGKDANPVEEGAPAPGERQTWGTPRPMLTRAMALVAPHKQVIRRYMPTPFWWMAKRWLMNGSPVRTLERLGQSGVDILFVCGTNEAKRVYRGEQHRLQALIAKGEVRVETVAHLDHSLLERTSHDRVAELFGAYVARHAAALSGRAGGSAPS
jgi:hypothetical protein